MRRSRSWREFAGVLPVDRATSIGQAWLQARVLDRSGETAAAVDVLEAAVDGTLPATVRRWSIWPGSAPTVATPPAPCGCSSRPASSPPDADDDEDDDRDDAELLWDEVEGFATHRPRPTARRNDPCPCGSGRKYKACHLGRETHSLDDRAGWLYLKAQRFLRDRHP